MNGWTSFRAALRTQKEKKNIFKLGKDVKTIFTLSDSVCDIMQTLFSCFEQTQRRHHSFKGVKTCWIIIPKHTKSTSSFYRGEKFSISSAEKINKKLLLLNVSYSFQHFLFAQISTFFSKCFLFLGEGAMGMSGDGMMSPDGKPKTDVKDDSGPANEPHKPKVPPWPFSSSIFLCNSLSPSHVFVFFDVAPLMKPTRSDQHMLPQHSGLFLCCLLAIFNDLFNIYHS